MKSKINIGTSGGTVDWYTPCTSGTLLLYFLCITIKIHYLLKKSCNVLVVYHFIIYATETNEDLSNHNSQFKKKKKLKNR